MNIDYVKTITGEPATDALALKSLYRLTASQIAQVLQNENPDEFTIYSDANQPMISATLTDITIKRDYIIPVTVLKALTCHKPIERTIGLRYRKETT